MKDKYIQRASLILTKLHFHCVLSLNNENVLLVRLRKLGNDEVIR